MKRADEGGLPKSTSSCGHTCQKINGYMVAEEYVVEVREINDTK